AISVPAQALLDVPVSVSVHGLPPGARTTLTATARDAHGTTWTSSAQFQATATGAISLQQPSLAGSYTGSQPMGLFEFMAPPAGDLTSRYFQQPETGYDVTLVASVGGRRVASATTHRQTWQQAGVTKRQLRPAADKVYGELFSPADTGTRHPAVLVFGGSEGGLSMGFAAGILAAHGYPALSLAYFKEPGLPPSLADVPLEYFTRALALLRRQPGVDPKHVLVFGVSRGSEAALLLGSHFPRLVNGVIAGVPSSVVNPGYPNPARSAWTLGGKPVPAITREEWTDTSPADPRAVIAVERIRGPVLLACGLQDQIWPSCVYQDAIASRLTSHHFGYRVIDLRYPDAGHDVGGMNAIFSATAIDFPHGGSLAGNQAALADSHAQLLSFLAAQDAG
ncbi:MAG TPA: acyl-CoA thioesterase/bile acid-CoA:amino acid N-acyltransferase family protein, partial [Jatrophihabitans sp.]|nr:acyl-CoA thioesterase/bile acid-CoA:amino acid N-acyltransferase family protein [Jatrophihabitans sp.]